jgi:hypothetical protein
MSDAEQSSGANIVAGLARAGLAGDQDLPELRALFARGDELAAQLPTDEDQRAAEFERYAQVGSRTRTSPRSLAPSSA